MAAGDAAAEDDTPEMSQPAGALKSTAPRCPDVSARDIYGPIVMNAAGDLREAFRQIRDGTFIAQRR